MKYLLKFFSTQNCFKIKNGRLFQFNIIETMLKFKKKHIKNFYIALNLILKKR